MDSVCIFCSSIVIMSISLHFLTCRRRIWLCGPWADSPAETQRSWSHGDIPPAWSGEDNMGMTSGPGRIVVTSWNSWFMTSFIWFKAFPLFYCIADNCTVCKSRLVHKLIFPLCFYTGWVGVARPPTVRRRRQLGWRESDEPTEMVSVQVRPSAGDY